jgi:putative heme iron utilization protein
MALPTSNEGSGFAARRLLRAARMATLATSGPEGQPFASLVTPAAAADGSVLLLLSDLAEHTRHLRADPRCSVLVTGPAEEVNPQTAPRLSLTGMAEPDTDPTRRARYLAIHPYAALYAGFGDFRLWRMRPAGGLLVIGFARAMRLRQSDLAPEPASVAALGTAEPTIVAHCNQDHPDALARIAGAGGDWRMVAADVDGCDLAQGERVLRVAWSAPAGSVADVRRELVRLARPEAPG